MKWLVMIALVLAGVWYLARPPETPAALAPDSTEQVGNRAGRALADKTLSLAQMDVSVLENLGERLRKACSRNKYGLSEQECLSKLDERDETCVAHTTERYPGAISDTSRMQEVASSYVKCIFEES